MAKKSPPFLVAPNSPFPDGYDIVGERSVLKHLIEADNIDPLDPLYNRFVEYEQRESQLRKTLDARRPPSSPTLVQQVSSIGNLQADEDDLMELHTRDAMRLFVGRQSTEAVRAIAGGRRVAASLRQLWALSSNDNPYADWMLVTFDDHTRAVRASATSTAERVLAKLEGMRQKGLSYSVLKSTAPVQVKLGFASPYGYSIATTIVEFDWLSRVVKSAQRKDVLSSNEAHAILFGYKRDVRAVFEPVVRASDLLYRDQLKALTRADFISDDDEAKRRVAAATGLFGMCPRDVFVGKREPRHTRRSVRLSAAEQTLLESIPLADDLGGDQGLI
jgi:integrating conjugative element protein (TIGR03761 family)